MDVVVEGCEVVGAVVGALVVEGADDVDDPGRH